MHVLSALCLAVALAACAEPPPPPPPAAPASPGAAALAATVDAHVAAIGARDLDALLATVTARDTLTLVFPDGAVLPTRQAFVDFHRAWFADTSWTMTLRPVSSTVRDGLGIALLETTYTDAAGPRDAVLALTFADEDGAWRLVFDQNTRVAAGP